MIEPGNVVLLNSGGPEMTVESIDAETACCIWMSSRYESFRDPWTVQREKFPVACLHVKGGKKSKL